ncbi:hypothetical protein BN12_2400002 [Nostocoides japonicum T1-X7]|uniref:Uncharacterized protein n=1 Tax=Nostocoides japonicum T1-X7 TaxID=1194083 RepID=A0A077LVM5_9MICO|nr:hypothetical protein BN12_2400002 [Tetrasphaera japonica T1-X7]
MSNRSRTACSLAPAYFHHWRSKERISRSRSLSSAPEDVVRTGCWETFTHRPFWWLAVRHYIDRMTDLSFGPPGDGRSRHAGRHVPTGPAPPVRRCRRRRCRHTPMEVCRMPPDGGRRSRRAEATLEP